MVHEIHLTPLWGACWAWSLSEHPRQKPIPASRNNGRGRRPEAGIPSRNSGRIAAACKTVSSPGADVKAEPSANNRFCKELQRFLARYLLTIEFVPLYSLVMDSSDANQKAPDDSIRPSREGRVPTPAVRRLSLYLRELEALQKENRQTFSSRQLGDALSLTDAQVRKDLAYFGQFGRPGKGYSVNEMIARIRRILGTDRTWTALLVGVGNLGTALLSYRGFFGKGFEIVAAFDNDPAVIGQVLGLAPGMEILPMERLESVIADRGVQMAILCVPADAAQALADRLVAAGIKGILNFAPRTLTVPETVSLASVDLAQRLEQLAFHICANQVLHEKCRET